MQHAFCLAASSGDYLLGATLRFGNNLVTLLKHISGFSQFFWESGASLIQHIKEFVRIDEFEFVHTDSIINKMLEQIEMLIDRRLLVGASGLLLLGSLRCGRR